MQEKLEEKRTEKEEENTSRAEKLIKDKVVSSQDGLIYVDDAEMREMMEEIQTLIEVARQKSVRYRNKVNKSVQVQ